MEQREVLAELRDVSLTCGKKPCLDGIHLTIHPGEWVGLAGPSGSGKTSLLKVLAGKAAPSEGKMDFNAPEKGRPGAVLQGAGLSADFRLRYQMLWRLGRQGIRGREAEQQIRAALEMMEVADCGDQFPDEMAYGQRMRAEVALALAARPALLLLDDPFCALDGALRYRLLKRLRAWQQETGGAVVYATASHPELFSLSDRMVLLQAGRIIQQGSPEEMLEAPSCHFAAAFWGRGNLLPGVVTGCGEGKAALEMEGLTLPCKTHEMVTVGEKRGLYIRYQGLYYSRQPGKDKWLSGILKEYCQTADGPMALIELSGGRRIVAPARRNGDCTLGCRVFLWWNRDGARLLPWDESAEAQTKLE